MIKTYKSGHTAEFTEDNGGGFEGVVKTDLGHVIGHVYSTNRLAVQYGALEMIKDDCRAVVDSD